MRRGNCGFPRWARRNGDKNLAPEPSWALARRQRPPALYYHHECGGWSNHRASRVYTGSSGHRSFASCGNGEQVAAVCYRVAAAEALNSCWFRLRGGRWTFPKGGVEPGLTHAQTAALEAFEEAGVHGRMEEQSFARYTRRKRSDRPSLAVTEIAVHAHLCKVSRLSPPQEAGRNPTWFSPEKAKRRLQADRAADDGAEFCARGGPGRSPHPALAQPTLRRERRAPEGPVRGLSRGWRLMLASRRLCSPRFIRQQGNVTTLCGD